MPKDVRIRLEADSSAELQEDIDRYHNSYPSIGYDTKVIKTDLEDGKYIAYVSRLDSCD
jgi:uncharacterized protein (UPF0335 family)